METFWKSD